EPHSVETPTRCGIRSRERAEAHLSTLPGRYAESLLPTPLAADVRRLPMRMLPAAPCPPSFSAVDCRAPHPGLCPPMPMDEVPARIAGPPSSFPSPGLQRGEGARRLRSPILWMLHPRRP